MPVPPSSPASDWPLIALFLLAIAAPGAWTAWSREPFDPAREFRKAAVAPALPRDARALAAYPKAAEDWFSDRFRGRSLLVRLHSLLKVLLFRVSPSDIVFLGPDDWIYLGRPALIDTARHAKPFTTEELERWRTLLERRRAWLAERGAQYLVCIAPEKSSIYPEHVPARYRPVRERSRYDEFVDYMRAHSQVDVLDLRTSLRALKRELEDGYRGDPHGQPHAYYPLGSHWNELGAQAAAHALLERLSVHEPGFVVPAREDYQFKREWDVGDNLASRFYLEDLPRFEQWGYNLLLKQRKPLRVRRFVGVPGTNLLFSTEGRTRERLVLFRDSFGTALYPFLLPHFETTAVIWRPDFAREFVERLEARFVVHEMAERELMQWNQRLEDELQGRLEPIERADIEKLQPIATSAVEGLSW